MDLLFWRLVTLFSAVRFTVANSGCAHGLWARIYHNGGAREFVLDHKQSVPIKPGRTVLLHLQTSPSIHQVIPATTMPRAKRALAEVDPNAQIGVAKKFSKSKATRTSASIDADSHGADAANGKSKNATSEENDDSNVMPA